MPGHVMAQPILLMTRPKESAQRFLDRFSSPLMTGARVIFSPLIEIVPLASDQSFLTDYVAIFTSENGVRFGPAAEGRTAHCVGDVTAQAAAQAGWYVGEVKPTADDLVSRLVERQVTGLLIHFSGVHRRGDIAERLTHADIATSAVTVYDQRASDLTTEAKDALAGSVPVIAPLFSPRTAEIFLTAHLPLTSCRIAALSPAVAQVFEADPPQKMLVAEAPTGSEMARCVEKLLSDTS
jgi:uroporphyrinogen-III synthase